MQGARPTVMTMTQCTPAELTSRPNLVLPLAIGLFCLTWSSAFAAGKIALADCPPLLLLCMRFLTAGALMLGVAILLGRGPWPRGRDLAAHLLAGLLGNAVYLGFSYSGLVTVSSGLTALIISANPILTALLARPLLGEPLGRRTLVGLGLGLAGVALILRHRLGAGAEDVHGVLLILVALVALSASAITYKRLKPRGDLLVANGIQALASGLALGPFALGLEDVGAIHWTPRFIAAFTFLLLTASVAAYLLWMWLLNRYSATQASAWHFVMPPLGLLIGWAVLGEPVAAIDLIGIIPVAIGIAMVTRKS